MQKLIRLASGCAVAALLAVDFSTPALAGRPILIPEPTTLSLMGTAVVGLILATRLRRRK